MPEQGARSRHNHSRQAHRSRSHRGRPHSERGPSRRRSHTPRPAPARAPRSRRRRSQLHCRCRPLSRCRHNSRHPRRRLSNRPRPGCPQAGRSRRRRSERATSSCSRLHHRRCRCRDRRRSRRPLRGCSPAGRSRHRRWRSHRCIGQPRSRSSATGRRSRRPSPARSPALRSRRSCSEGLRPCRPPPPRHRIPNCRRHSCRTPFPARQPATEDRRSCSAGYRCSRTRGHRYHHRPRRPKGQFLHRRMHAQVASEARRNRRRRSFATRHGRLPRRSRTEPRRRSRRQSPPQHRHRGRPLSCLPRCRRRRSCPNCPYPPTCHPLRRDPCRSHRPRHLCRYRRQAASCCCYRCRPRAGEAAPAPRVPAGARTRGKQPVSPSEAPDFWST